MRYGVLGVERCVLWRSPRKRRLKREYLNLQHCNLHVFVSQSTDSLLLDHEHGTKVRWICQTGLKRDGRRMLIVVRKACSCY